MAGQLLGGYFLHRWFRKIDPNEQAAKDAFEEEVLLDGLVKGVAWNYTGGFGLSDKGVLTGKEVAELNNKRLDEEVLGITQESTTKKSI